MRGVSLTKRQIGYLSRFAAERCESIEVAGAITRFSDGHHGYTHPKIDRRKNYECVWHVEVEGKFVADGEMWLNSVGKPYRHSSHRNYFDFDGDKDAFALWIVENFPKLAEREDRILTMLSMVADVIRPFAVAACAPAPLAKVA